jgi:poly(A) polymerase
MEKLEKLICKIQKISEGYEVFGVGGFARDLIINRKHTDVDLAVNKDALKYSKKLAKILNAVFVVLDKEKEIYRLILKNEIVANIDISLLDGKTILDDLKKRDFTINAAAFNIDNFSNFKKNLIFADDKCIKDLKSKTINVVSQKTFKQDPLRMLRAFRFAAELNFNISQNTLKQIKTFAPLIKKTASERIKAEFFRILNVKDSAPLIKQMDKSALLGEIFTEIVKMKKAPKKFYYHKGGLFEHSLETFEAAEKILSNLKKYFPKSYDDLEKHFDQNSDFSEYVSRKGLLKLAALFHDNAKPETAKKIDGRIRFLDHEEIGAKKIQKIMETLRAGKNDTAFICSLVINHMRPSNLTKNNVVTKRAQMKFFRDIADKTPEQIILSMADWHSYKPLKIHSRKELKNQEKTAQAMMFDYFELKKQKPLAKIIDGNIIMKEFKLKPGPWIGEMINLVLDKQNENKVKDTKSALAFIRSKLTAILKKYKIVA